MDLITEMQKCEDQKRSVRPLLRFFGAEQ